MQHETSLPTVHHRTRSRVDGYEMKWASDVSTKLHRLVMTLGFNYVWPGVTIRATKCASHALLYMLHPPRTNNRALLFLG